MGPDNSLTIYDDDLALIETEDVDDGDEEVADAPRVRAPRAMSADTLAKLIDSGRGEIRSFRGLYFALFGIGLLAPTPIAAIYRATDAAGSSGWLIASVTTWGIGSILILLGGFRMLPAFRWRVGSLNESSVNIAIDTAVREPEERGAQEYLAEALDIIHEMQERVVIGGKLVVSGTIFVFFAVLITLIRWIALWQEVRK